MATPVVERSAALPAGFSVSPSSYDSVFRPRQEPHRTLYDAFQAEATRRKGRTADEWTEAEVQAVWRAAVQAAPAHGLAAPTLEMVRQAEAYARGSIDYGLQWACALVRSMRAGRDLAPPKSRMRR